MEKLAVNAQVEKHLVGKDLIKMANLDNY